MAHILADRVKETTTTTGTGTLSLAGAATGFQAFSAVLANNDTTLYAIVGGTEWEVGLGTWTTGNNLARTTVLESSNADAAVSFSAGTKDVWITYTPKGEIPTLKLAAGAAAAGGAPLKITPGILLTTPEDGALEVDATNLYFTHDPANRGYVPVKHFIRCNATRTLPNDTNLNAIFNSPANGRLTLETGVYLFQTLIVVTAMSATSGNCLINLQGAGTATAGAWLWRYQGIDNTNVQASVDDDDSFPVTNATAGPSMVAAATGTAVRFFAEGSFKITVAGSFIPSIDLATAAAAIVSEGSYFVCERIGSDSVVSVGQWD